MARIGEGDPRWIVEERDDATNVNNWHWREKDVFKWSTEKLTELIKAVKITGPTGMVSFTDCTFDGVATLSVRKGKLKKILDIESKITFEAQTTDSESDLYKGTIEINDFNYDTNPNSIQFITNFNDNKRNEPLMIFIKTETKKKLVEIFKDFIITFDNELTHDLILPTKGSSNDLTTASSSLVDTKTTIKKLNEESKKIVESVPSTKVDTKKGVSINLQEEFNIVAHELFNFFIDPEKMMLITNSPAFIKPVVNGEFSFLDGSIVGTFSKIEQGKTIVMNWRMRAWPSDYFSVATLTFLDIGPNKSRFQLIHQRILAHELERVDAGWRRMFLGPIKQLFQL